MTTRGATPKTEKQRNKAMLHGVKIDPPALFVFNRNDAVSRWSGLTSTR
jgi:hypothetical protein